MIRVIKELHSYTPKLLSHPAAFCRNYQSNTGPLQYRDETKRTN